jgi:hypothetical protein
MPYYLHYSLLEVATGIGAVVIVALLVVTIIVDAAKLVVVIAVEAIVDEIIAAEIGPI